MGLFSQIRDDPLLIGLLFVRGHLGFLNSVDSVEFVERLTIVKTAYRAAARLGTQLRPRVSRDSVFRLSFRRRYRLVD
jgi:hypothetical protein